MGGVFEIPRLNRWITFQNRLVILGHPTRSVSYTHLDVYKRQAQDDDELKSSQYRVLELWQNTYEGALRIMLPDTFGTTQFLEGAPDWAADWTGQRIDSKDPYVAGDEYIEWLKARGREPKDKLLSLIHI